MGGVADVRRTDCQSDGFLGPMTSRRVMVAMGFVEHLSASSDLMPLCNQFSGSWTYFEVRRPCLPLCRKCRGILRRLNDLAA